MTSTNHTNIIINGWHIFAHPLFINEVSLLLSQVEELKKKEPVNFIKKNATKKLAAITKLAFIDIPKDPTDPKYRQGSTLGDEYTHWFRAKFFQQYRLFFRFDSGSKIIVFAWINNEKNKRAYKSKTDAYNIFKNMLNKGNPPDNLEQLLKVAQTETEHLQNIYNQSPK